MSSDCEFPLRWGEAKPHLRTLLAEDRLSDDEPIVLKFPRKEARKRIRNTEKKSRVVFVTTPENFSAFHAARAHVLEVVGNPTLTDQLISEVIAGVPDDTWQRLMEVGK